MKDHASERNRILKYGSNLVGTVHNRAVVFCTLYYTYKISFAILLDAKRRDSQIHRGRIATGKQGGPCDSQYVAVNITNGGRNNRAECLQFRDVHAALASAASSTIIVCSDGRLLRTVQSDSLGLHGRLRRTEGARRVRYKSRACLCTVS